MAVTRQKKVCPAHFRKPKNFNETISNLKSKNMKKNSALIAIISCGVFVLGAIYLTYTYKNRSEIQATAVTPTANSQAPQGVPAIAPDQVTAQSAIPTQRYIPTKESRMILINGRSMPLSIVLGLPFEITSVQETFEAFRAQAINDPRAATHASMLMGKCQDFSILQSKRSVNSFMSDFLVECKAIPFSDYTQQDSFKLRALRSDDYENVKYVTYHPPVGLDQKARSEIRERLEVFSAAGNLDSKMRLAEMLIEGNVLIRDIPAAINIYDDLSKVLPAADSRRIQITRMQLLARVTL